MPINISKALESEVPDVKGGGNLKDILWAKSGGICALCDGTMNEASDEIEVDHDLPRDRGGNSELANLQLTHRTCNRAKRSAGTLNIRPYLKLRRFLAENGGRVKYDGVLGLFEITPKKCVVTLAGDTASFDLPDGRTTTNQIFTEASPGGVWRYCFVDLPRDAIFSDQNVQPRVIQERHAYAIYRDLQNNPLYEPPGCRLEATHGETCVLMFDGQHKTLASWMLDRATIVAKVYLDLSTDDAVELVNSIQAKIKKLPLSAFEIAGKMADEFANKMEAYEESCHDKNLAASESGFIESLDAEDRTRGKQAFREALYNSLLDSPNLRVLDYVKRPGTSAERAFITESQLKNKVLKEMLHTDTLIDPVETTEVWRGQEEANAARLLNTFVEKALDPDAGSDYSERKRIAVDRMTYQQALAEISRLLVLLFKHTMKKEDSDLFGNPSEENWTHIERGVGFLVEHPMWFADFGISARMKLIQNALSKNQQLRTLLPPVGLTLGYLLEGPSEDGFQAAWSGVDPGYE